MARTQKEKVLEYIRKHGSISQFEAYKLGYITRLSGIIYYLKHEDGYKIRTKLEKNPKTQKVYARYFLEE